MKEERQSTILHSDSHALSNMMWGEMFGGRSERHLITLLVLLRTEYLTEKDRQVRSTSVEVHPPAI